jgi:transcriptional regulator with XRE-family HTH domain
MGTFGEWLMRELGQREWSERKFGAMLGVSGTAVGRWKRGEREPSREDLLKIATALDVSPVIVGMAYLGVLPERAEVTRLNRLPPDAQAEVLAAMQELVDLVYQQTEETRQSVAAWAERWARSGGATGMLDTPGGT